MKVILRKDVAGVGLKNEVKEVSNGYAQNFLIGRGLAEAATSAKIQRAEKFASERQAQLEAEKEALTAGIAKLKGGALIIHATANEKDHLFEALSTETIAAHLRDVLGVSIEAGAVKVSGPIKELGDYTVEVTAGDSKLPIKIKVESN